MREGAGALEPAAAIDGDALALDVGGMIGDEEGREIGQFLRPPGPAERACGGFLLPCSQGDGVDERRASAGLPPLAEYLDHMAQTYGPPPAGPEAS